MKRRYFIVKIPNENVIHSLNVCIGLNITQKYNLDKSLLYVKTNSDCILKELEKDVRLNKVFPPGLTTEYTYEEILVILQGEEWQTAEL
jgi:predicted type IV restriction endonuclease